MSLQIAVGEERLSLFYFKGYVSTQSVIARGTVPTEFGILKTVPTRRDVLEYEMGSPGPRSGIEVPQREIFDDILDNTGASVPDVVIKCRGVIEPIPREVEDLKLLQGSGYVFYMQRGYGSFPHLIRKRIGIPVENPYYHIRYDLIEKGIILTRSDPRLKRIRSVLKTEWLVTDNLGWLDLGDPGILSLELALTRRKWWTDVGKPIRILPPTFRSNTIYRLLRRDIVIAV